MSDIRVPIEDSKRYLAWQEPTNGDSGRWVYREGDVIRRGARAEEATYITQYFCVDGSPEEILASSPEDLRRRFQFQNRLLADVEV